MTADDFLTSIFKNALAEPVPNTSNFKVDQIAFAAKDISDAMAVKRMFGLDQGEWTEDEVLAVGRVNGVLGANRARLLFNYDLGIEFEILQYLEGPNYIDHAGIQGRQICHIGMHWDGTGNKPKFGPAIQDVRTVTHTNPFLLSRGRKYQYTIHDTLKSRGVFLKVIERLEDHEPDAFVEVPDADTPPPPAAPESGTDDLDEF